MKSGTFTRTLRLDSDGLVDNAPRKSDHAKFAGDQALCEVLASALSNGGAVGRQSEDTVAAGLGRVTVADRLLHGSRLGGLVTHESIDGIESIAAKTPAPTPYRDRLAWVVVVEDSEAASCGNQGATPLPRHTEPGLHGYAVFIIDAGSGGDALLYTERMNPICPGGRPEGPWVDVPLTTYSVPWRLISRAGDGSGGEVRFTVGRCDGYPGVILAGDGTQAPNIVRVLVTRPFGQRCEPPRLITEKLRAAVLGQPLPSKLAHAPVGPYVG